MDRDTEHLNLLAIFHYVVAGLAALFSFFPLLYTAIGVIFIFAARHGTAKPGEELPPEFLGWIFAVLGSVLFVIGIAMAICIFIAGRSLALAQALLVRARDGLHRMSLRSVRNDSRSLYDHCAFARVRESVVRAQRRRADRTAANVRCVETCRSGLDASLCTEDSAL